MSDSIQQLKSHKTLPRVSALPWIGNFFKLLNDSSGFFIEQKKKHGELFISHYFGKDNVMLLGKQANKFVLVEQSRYFSNELGWEGTLDRLFPNAIMLMDGEKHQYHRNILSAAFKKSPLEGYMALMQPIVQQFSEELKEKNKLQLFPTFKQLTLEIAGRVFFGLDLSKDLSEINTAIVQVVKASMALPINLPFTKFGKGLRGRKKLETYFKSIIAEKRANPQQDLFSILCTAKSEAGDQLNDQEIIDHLIFILMAGHDTTASSLTTLSYLLAKHPEWQEKLRAEVQTFDAEHGSDYQLKDLRKLEMMSLCIKESLRMYPPLIMIPRVSTEKIAFAGYEFPPEQTFVIVLEHNHYNNEIWDNPKAFDPMRFTSERREHQRCPHSYAPFGAGVHHCLGFAFAEMKIKLIISTMLRNFRWSVADNYEMDIQQVPIQEPKDGLPIQLEKIS